MCGIDQKVHEHLVELGWKALDVRYLAVGFDNLCLVFDFVVHDIERGINPVMDIRQYPILGGVDP
ncbi:hypothetical protein D3C71_1847920 [compost metagenome]